MNGYFIINIFLEGNFIFITKGSNEDTIQKQEISILATSISEILHNQM